ncbi:MAG: tyrosine-type recombinase/integrase [Aurantimonas endophytica]|uniref:tyrosine-type recombinase/integrase n=1 Tax=Aurantimonas endophytica TaxID=1522175 RepID=UPI00300178DA
MAKALTAKQIEAIKGGAARQELPDRLLPGLYLVVQTSGAKSWAIRYRAHGRPKKLTLGTWPALDLSSARNLARGVLRAVAEGGDPASEKKAARLTEKGEPDYQRDLVETVVAEFIQRHVRPNNRSSTAKETERLLSKEVLSAWRGRRIQDITKRDVLDLLDRIVDRGAEISANRTLAAMRRMFNWCIDRGILDVSPCDRVRAPTVERPRDRVLSDEEIRLVWAASEKIGWPFGPMVQLLILTAQRRGEVAGLRWTEIDFDRKLWTIPKERSKNGLAHDVPLSSAAINVLHSAPVIASDSGFVFTTTGRSVVSGNSRAKSRLDGAIREAVAAQKVSDAARTTADLQPWTIHDIRRTAATGMAKLGVSLPVVEKLLNHSSGSFAGVAGVYQRHSFGDEKRAAVEAWGSYVGSLSK